MLLKWKQRHHRKQWNIDEEIQQNDGIYNYEIEAGCHEWNVTHADT